MNIKKIGLILGLIVVVILLSVIFLNTLFSSGLNSIEGKYSDESISFYYPVETFPYVQTPETLGGYDYSNLIESKSFHSKEENISMDFQVIKINKNWSLEEEYENFMGISNNSNLIRTAEFVNIDKSQGLLVQSEQKDAPTNYKHSIIFIFEKDNKKYHFWLMSDDIKLLNSTYVDIKNSLIIK
ncbi:hypothetical protein [Methanobrevibacter sp. DSM 116169]|uniref:hypothetical protein n=1 Tax=Methanobrevibacter sp. DSM 116169 TaxID=3242727 RepID=UPI0038FCD3E4